MKPLYKLLEMMLKKLVVKLFLLFGIWNTSMLSPVIYLSGRYLTDGKNMTPRSFSDVQKY